MTYNRSKFFPIIVTVLIIIIIIYLFANLEQSNVKCSKRTTDSFNITVVEELNATLDGRKINELKLRKTIILPEKYAKDKYLDSVEYTLKKSYAYLGKDKVSISKLSDRIIVDIVVNKNETLILNNISFDTSNDLTININSNTKSSDVVTLKVNDNYTQGEFITHLKNNGYSCG